jgi:hypothetical protein
LAPFGGSQGSLGHPTGPNERMVDIGGGRTVKVNVIRGEDGLEKGEYFDPSSNMKFTIQLHGDPVTTQTSTKVRSTSVSCQICFAVSNWEIVGNSKMDKKLLKNCHLRYSTKIWIISKVVHKILANFIHSS